MRKTRRDDLDLVGVRSASDSLELEELVRWGAGRCESGVDVEEAMSDEIYPSVKG